MTTTVIPAEALTSKMSAAESIMAALRFLEVDLVLDGDGIKAIGKTSNLDPDLVMRMKRHKSDLIARLRAGDEVIAKAGSCLESATSYLEIETALAMVIDAFDGKLVGYDSIEDFSRRAREHSRGMPAEGAGVR